MLFLSFAKANGGKEMKELNSTTAAVTVGITTNNKFQQT